MTLNNIQWILAVEGSMKLVQYYINKNKKIIIVLAALSLSLSLSLFLSLSLSP